MGNYAKQPVAPGQTISSTWGNDVQTQFEAVVGVDSADVTEILAAFLPKDTRTTVITRTGGVITAIAEQDNGANILRYTFTRTNGLLTSLEIVGGTSSVTFTFNRVGGKISSITKTVGSVKGGI